MNFDAELVPYCGGVYRVKTKVERFINEGTGRMAHHEDTRCDTGRCLVPISLQQPPNVLSKKYLLMVA